MICDREIRILSLLPYGDDCNAPIICEIRVASLDEDPEYETLSYVWGSADNLADVQVSGQKVGVTKNLLTALRRLRLSKEPRPLWIDQLCINQWDLAEKASQVRLMRDIYSRCSCCLIWMGEVQEGIPEGDAEKAFEFIEHMAAIADADGADRERVPVPPFCGSDTTFRGPMKALETLSIDGNPWWARVWTVQEAVLPKRLAVHWGPLSIPWDRTTQAAHTWTTYGPPHLWDRFREPYCSFLHGLMALIIWLVIAKQGGDGPAELVQRWRFREATDPRDKIYALLGLYKPGQLPTIEKCDYNMSAADVFCELTFDMIRSSKSLIPLIMDPRLEPEKATAGIPRWALDVSHISEYNTDWYHLYGWGYYNANGGRALDLARFESRVQQERHLLPLDGVMVDTIQVVGDKLLRSRASDDSWDTDLLQHLRDWERLARQHVRKGAPDSEVLYAGDITLREAFGRLMLGDFLRDEEQWVEDGVDREDVESVYGFLESGHKPWAYGTIKGQAQNQTFFITKTGLLGTGHRDTQPGDEVWVLDGGKVPFTLTPRKDGGDDDYDFGGRCYVQGIMNGEVFLWEDRPVVERIARIH
ncbi:hypothetical protein ACJ41O_011570 [Fusarium nematophilum]